MDPATPAGETPGATDPKTNANPTPAPQTPAVDPALEALRKEKEQAEMRANQLANQLKAKEEAEAAAEEEKLKEQNKFKDLYEAEKAKREEIETAAEKAAREAALKTESDTILSAYPDEVKNLAQELGVELADTDEDTVAAFKAKLDKVSGSIKPPKVTPNNPGAVPTPATGSTPQEMYEIMRDPTKFDEYVKKNFKGVASMTRPQA